MYEFEQFKTRSTELHRQAAEDRLARVAKSRRRKMVSRKVRYARAA